MAKYTSDFRKFIAEERIVHNKSFTQIEREHGVLRGTVYPWIKRYQKGTLFLDKRTTKDQKNKERQEYEFLKKSFALLKEIRSKQQE